MFEQDYVMRLITEIIRTILKLLFNVDTESPTVDFLENKEQKETLKNLLDLVDTGKINEAENKLYALISDTDMNSLEVALLFYSYLSDKTDDFLEASEFSRDEIKLGIENVADIFGLSNITLSIKKVQSGYQLKKICQELRYGQIYGMLHTVYGLLL